MTGSTLKARAWLGLEKSGLVPPLGLMLQRGKAPIARNLDKNFLFSKPGPSNDFELKARTQKVRTGIFDINSVQAFP